MTKFDVNNLDFGEGLLHGVAHTLLVGKVNLPQFDKVRPHLQRPLVDGTDVILHVHTDEGLRRDRGYVRHA